MTDTPKYNLSRYYGTHYTAESLTSVVISHIEEEDLTVLEITGKGSYKLTFKEQFESNYIDMPLRRQDMKWATSLFFKIFEENKLMISQIKRMKEEIKKLEDPTNWRNTNLAFSYSKSNSTGKGTSSQGGITSMTSNITDSGKDSTKTYNAIFTGSQTGITDNNSKVEDKEDLEDLIVVDKKQNTLRERISIPDNPLELNLIPNQINQANTINIVDKELELNKGTSSNNTSNSSTAGANISEDNIDKQNVMIGKTTSMNVARETLDALRVQLPAIRRNFIDSFGELFVY